MTTSASQHCSALEVKKMFCHDILLKSLSVIMTDHLGRWGQGL